MNRAERFEKFGRRGRRFELLVQELVLILLTVLVAQPFDLSWPELPGTRAAFGGGLTELREIGLMRERCALVAVWSSKRRQRASIWCYVGEEWCALIKGRDQCMHEDNMR
jgi:hypothetical protein